jgi:hypothetical protein
LAVSQQVFQALLDEDSMPGLHAVWVKVGKCQDPHANAS